ncbi:hypothetical protein J23TS9_19250 [Paenibacillus sp. J23TS9]|uniref:DUF5301 domain-containing protein n=1 Tax=Paenibacillus sp. J23TS9 TaxID=2807193 RepID=UPI001B217156|nr:DUF5301 domain-containing protein [Paenibacillus sp. J23TS9]GIP26795.1 hypothetical protein J23TS9_19250 [Paenibacillus sp. J23TS9]
MKKYDKYIPLFVILYILALVGTVFYIVGIFTSFEREVTTGIIEGKEVTSIQINRLQSSTDQEIIVKDKKEIAKIMDSFSKVKLRETSSSHIRFKRSYWMTIHVGNERRLLLTLYDDKFLTIYNPEKSKDKSRFYKIRNRYDLKTIEDVFTNGSL